MKLLILTAKHHDGFCLWPTQYTDHCVKNSPWRGGEGDVVARSGRRLPRGAAWSSASPVAVGPPRADLRRSAALQRFQKQLRELLTGYGRFAEVWFDGACGEGPNGKRQVYDWPGYPPQSCRGIDPMRGHLRHGAQTCAGSATSRLWPARASGASCR